jgi:hypothetical protein
MEFDLVYIVLEGAVDRFLRPATSAEPVRAASSSRLGGGGCSADLQLETRGVAEAARWLREAA